MAVIFSEDFNSFTGSGFAPAPGAGQLDSDFWRVTGLSDGDGTFGGTHDSGDFARGSSSGGVSTGGVYAFDVGSGNDILGVQPIGTDFTPGEFFLKITNTTGSTISDLDISYDILYNNDQPRANSLNFAWSLDDSFYTDVPALDFTTPEAADASGWQSNAKNTTISGLSLANGSDIYLRWQGNDDGGSGSRDEYGIDNILVETGAVGGTELAIAPTTQNEGDSGTTAFTFDVTRSGDTSGTTTVDFATSDGTAVAGDDFNSSTGTLTFNPTETSQTITVNVIGDTEFEDDESFSVGIFNPSGGATISTASADGTIQTDDTDTVISGTNVTLYDGTTGATPDNATATANGQWLEHFNILLVNSAPTVNSSPVQSTITNATKLNTTSDINIYALYSNYNDGDLNPLTPPVAPDDLVNSNFPTLDNTQGYMVNFTIKVNSETNNGDDYNMDGQLDRAGFSAIVVSEDTTKAIELSFEDDRIWAQDVVGTATTDLLQAEGVSFDTTQQRDYNIKVLGDNYTLFADGTPILGGSLRDYTGVNLGTLPNAYQTANGVFLGDRTDDAGADVDIYNVSVTTEDTELAIAPNNATQAEGDSGNTFFTFDVTRSGDTSGTTTVDFATSDGTAVTGDDFNSSTGTLTFNPAETSKTITVNVIGDTEVEDDESFSVGIFNPSGAATISTASANGTIQDDDTAVSVLNSLVFNEVLPDPNSGTNNFDTDGDGTAETADEFVEIYNTSGNTLDISGLQFWDSGSDNYFTIPNGTILGANGFVTVVANVEGGSLPSVPSGSFAFSAGGGLSLSNTGDNLVLYDPATDKYIQAVYNGDGVDAPETMPNGNYAGFSATATRIGSVLDFGNDTDGVSLALSPDGTTTNPVQHNTIGDGTVLATPGNSNIASTTTLAIAPNNATQAEGDSGTTAFTFTVTRSGDTTGVTDVNYAISGDTDATDFGGTVPSGPVSFGAGETTKDITIDVSGDTDFETDENFTVTLSNATNGATITSDTASGTIQNDDSAATAGLTITESGGSTDVTEGGATDSYTIVLNSIPTADVTVTLANSDGEVSVDPTPLTFTTANWNTPQTVTVTAIDDSDIEDAHTAAIAHTVASSDNDYDGLSIPNVTANITDNDSAPPSLTKIHEIQGTTDTNLLDDTIVTIEGIVVGDFQDGDADAGRNLEGFYVQEEDADVDGDALTSEGIFVFEDGNFITDVNVGDLVQITGTVDEFFGETQIDTITDITVVSSSNTLPTAATVTLPATGTTTSQDGDLQPDLEAFEGMLVNFSDTLTITEMFQLDRFNEIKLSQGGRPEQFTQNNAPDVDGYAAHLEDIGARTITYDDGLSEQNASIGNLDGFGPTFNTATDIRMGDTIDNLSGVLNYQFDTWRVRSTEDGENTFAKVNNRPATPDDVGGDLKVASLNVLNYFTTLDDGSRTANGSGPRGADNITEFNRQTEKLVNALTTMDADVVGLVELENDFLTGSSGNAIENLVNELNAVVGAGTYEWVDPGTQFVGDDAIAVGVIYKPAALEITSGTSVEILTDSDLPGLGLGSLPAVFDGSSTNRSPLAVTFEEVGTGEDFTVVVNHFKSKGSPGTAATGDTDINDGAGNANQTRLNAATALDAWLDSDPTNSGDSDVIILGDLNAYAEETPITFLEGQGYTDLAQQFVGADAYSFVFDGQIGTLDYALANSSLLSQVTGTTEWHVNADEPDAIDYNTDFGRDTAIFDGTVPYRNSDHDPIIVGLDLNDPPVATDDSFTIDENDTPVTLNLLGNDTDPNADNLSIKSINNVELTTGTAETITVPNGTVNVAANGTITFTPDADYTGAISFDYVVQDGNGGEDTGSVTGTVNPVNDSPVATDDSFTIDENDTPVTLDLLGNDTDPNADTLSIKSINNVELTTGTTETITVPNGTVNVATDGTITFTPDADYTGPISFDYVVQDGNGGEDTGSVTGTVNPVNDPPVVNPPSLETIAVRRGNEILIDDGRNGTADRGLFYGNGATEDQYLVGDWDGDGNDELAVRRGNEILIDNDNDGFADFGIFYGTGTEDEYLVGDWDGDGIDEIAVRRGNELLMNHDTDGLHDQSLLYGLGNAEDQYLVGDWDGDGTDELAVRRGNQILIDDDSNGTADRELFFGTGTEDEYLVGDWDNDGIDEIAVRRGNEFLMNNDTDGLHDQSLLYGLGNAEDEYLIGLFSDTVL